MELTVEPLKVLIVDDEYLIRNLSRHAYRLGASKA